MNSHLAIQWQPSNETGIPILDEQHRGIVSIINSLAFSVKHYNVDFFINNICIMIDSYSKVHFTTEEELMRAAGYPGLESHKKMHEALINESFAIASRSLRMRDVALYLNFLEKWWMEHINIHDHKYSECIKRYLAL